MKDIILDTAQELMQRRGINGMSYGDISKAVKIQKASIHHHFPSKEDLINAVLNRYIDNYKDVLKEIISSQVKAKTKLQKLMHVFCETITDGDHDKTCLCGMLSAELLSLSDESSNLVQDFLNESQKAIQQILKEGLSDNSFNFNGNSKNMSELILSSLEGGLFISRVEGGPERFNKIIRQIEKIIIT